MNKMIIKAYAKKMSEQDNRPIRLYQAEAEIHRIIQEVAKSIAPSHTFGYHTRQDIEQQAIMYALEVLSEDPCRYDPSRPLENFLYIHLRNQLSNFKRKTYKRSERPCKCCNPFDPPAKPCKKWLDWNARNSRKHNIMKPLDVSYINDEGEARMSIPSLTEDEVAMSELERLIDRGLPADLRADYCRMKDNMIIPKVRRQRVREAIAGIAHDAGYLTGCEGLQSNGQS